MTLSFHKFKTVYDPQIYLDEIDSIVNAWNISTSRQKSIYVQKETESIPLRSKKHRMGVKNWDVQDTYSEFWYEEYFPHTKQFVDTFIETYGGEIGMVSWVKLPPEKKVYRHIDQGAYYRARDRFHFVIQGVYNYIVGDKEEVFSPGELWFFENQEEHEAINLGTVDRIALIFDVKDSNWREIENVKKEGA
jgi:quercetin dioxygenase-like cupin family protein